MATLYMTIGLPGSGKSYYANVLKENENVSIVSSDKLREELWGDENIQGDNELLFDTLQKRILGNLLLDRDVIYDATNINAKRRRKYLKGVKIECRKVCLFFLTDIDICKERNNSRERKVPEEVIERMYRTIQIPQYSEGWDEIRIIPCFDEKKEYNISKTMDKLIEIPHDNPHHTLSIGNHICAATKYIIDNYSLKFAGDVKRLYELVEAMFYHDVGKEYVKSFINSKGAVTETAHYYGHEYVSAYLYLLYKFKNRSEENNMSEEDWEEELKQILYVVFLIERHMLLNNVYSKQSISKVKQAFGKKTFENLCIMNEADKCCS